MPHAHDDATPHDHDDLLLDEHTHDHPHPHDFADDDHDHDHDDPNHVHAEHDHDHPHDEHEFGMTTARMVTAMTTITRMKGRWAGCANCCLLGMGTATAK